MIYDDRNLLEAASYSCQCGQNHAPAGRHCGHTHLTLFTCDFTDHTKPLDRNENPTHADLLLPERPRGSFAVLFHFTYN